MNFFIKLGRHVNHGKPYWFWGHSSKVKVTMGIIDKCGVRGDATLCVVIFIYSSCNVILFLICIFYHVPTVLGKLLVASSRVEASAKSTTLEYLIITYMVKLFSETFTCFCSATTCCSKNGLFTIIGKWCHNLESLLHAIWLWNHGEQNVFVKHYAAGGYKVRKKLSWA